MGGSAKIKLECDLFWGYKEMKKAGGDRDICIETDRVKSL